MSQQRSIIHEPVARPQRERHCSYCFRTDHNISRCTHPYVGFVFLELMWFYDRYGDMFVCNNLSNILRPKDAQVLLGYEPIKRITERPSRFHQVVEDVGMPNQMSKYYKKLSKKIESIYDNYPIHSRYFENMDVVEPIMNETLILYESMEHTTVMDSSSIMVNYNNQFIVNRGARFRHYNNIIEQSRSLPPPLTPFPPFSLPEPAHTSPVPPNPFPLLARYLPTTRNSPTANVLSEQETEPEWIENRRLSRTSRVPSNVTVRTHIRWEDNGYMRQSMEETFQFLVRTSRDFDIMLKPRSQEIEFLLESVAESDCSCIECPICMTENVDKKDSVNLGCCVYSFCSDCYSKQYLTKEQREYKCMMCRTPFSKVKVFNDSVIEKLKKTPPETIHIPFPVFSNNPNSVSQIEDDDFSDLPALVSIFP